MSMALGEEREGSPIGSDVQQRGRLWRVHEPRKHGRCHLYIVAVMRH